MASDQDIAKAVASWLEKYRPDQARGKDGRWVNEGGGSYSSRDKAATDLLRAGRDKAKFDAVFARVKKMPKVAVFDVANQFLNRPTKGKHHFTFGGKKKKALDTIRSVFAQRALEDDAADRLGRLYGGRR